MRKAGKIHWAIFFLLPFFVLNSGNMLANPIDDEDETPDVTARVARISFLRGEAKIKHADDRDWERATLNLPIVEGDEISTEPGARLEIQFNRADYLRLSENAYLKITTLRDEGIAVSLPEGKLSLRVWKFDKDRESFEIDAPRTTVAVEQSGMYRVDAGDKRDAAICVAVTEGGLARIYSENAGFSLRSGRSAEIQIAGNYAGDWDTSDAAKFTDEFDAWTLERDAVIAKLLQKADDDKYYDSEVYGAEDLSDYGEWIYTKKYGYVWRPYNSATSNYANWSPYRYGSWRWIPPYGWTWVNDEPWGYATYHHGRWIYVDDAWAWTPYGQHRTRRNWWRPALVVVGYAGNLICWYPLPYSYDYYNYNSIYIDRRRYNRTIINNTTVIVNPPSRNKNQRILNGVPIESYVPPSGVVAVENNEFGRGGKGIRSLPVETAKKVIEKTPLENENPPLPDYRNLKNKTNREVIAENPRNEKVVAEIRTGAMTRKSGVPVDENLRNERIYGNRKLIERTPPTTQEAPSNTDLRDTGAIKRERQPKPVENNTDSEKSRTRNVAPEAFPTRSKGDKSNDDNDSNQNSKPRNRVKEAPPTYTPPAEQPQERRERKEQRREVQPSPPQQEAPRAERPPKREEPRETKQTPREQPAPKEDRKSAPPPVVDRPEKGRPDKDNSDRDN